jgi:DNA-binding MarR family transcriptional regulator
VSHPEDARSTLAEITAKGRKLFDRAVEALNVKLFAAVALSPDELDQLVRLVRKIRAGAGDIVGVPGRKHA